jgi:hypothetical protein
MPISWNEIRDRATRFARDWKDASYERGEAQSFWNEFFAVFGMDRKRIYSFEKRVEKLGGATGYIDCFWPGTLIAEHKSRGKPLDKAHLQALDYLDGLKDRELPRYIVVSDFEFIVLHDIEGGTEHRIRTAELPKHIKLFGFIAGYQTQEARPEDPVNIKAAERMGKLHDQLKAVGYDGHDLEVMLVRLLFCMFADDTGIFQPPHAFEEWIEQRSNEDGSDLGSLLARFSRPSIHHASGARRPLTSSSTSSRTSTASCLPNPSGLPISTPTCAKLCSRPVRWTGAEFPRPFSAHCFNPSWTRKPAATWAPTTLPRPISSN